MKRLIVYYSLDGNTKEVAERIGREIKADVLRIVPEVDIPESGFAKFFEGGKLATFGKGTPLRPYGVDVNLYDQIILGSPVWAGKPVPAVNQFITSLQNPVRVIAAFAVSGSGKDGRCLLTLKDKCPNIKFTCSLADRSNQNLARENERRLKVFLDELKTLEERRLYKL